MGTIGASSGNNVDQSIDASISATRYFVAGGRDFGRDGLGSETIGPRTDRELFDGSGQRDGAEAARFEVIGNEDRH